MNILFLVLSVSSMVLQNGLFNAVSKKQLHNRTDNLYYNSLLYQKSIDNQSNTG